jgi:hypothetical protein
MASAEPRSASKKSTSPKGRTSPKAPARPGTRAALPEADPRFVPVAEALRRMSGFSLMESKSGALRGLMLNGKSFGMSSHGRFILKLDEEHVAALIADGTGKPFSASAKRTMKGWLEVTNPKANWAALAKLAHRLASENKGRPKPKKP